MISKEQVTKQALTHLAGVEAALRDGNTMAAHIIALDLIRTTEMLALEEGEARVASILALDPAYSGK